MEQNEQGRSWNIPECLGLTIHKRHKSHTVPFAPRKDQINGLSRKSGGREIPEMLARAVAQAETQGKLTCIESQEFHCAWFGRDAALENVQCL